jgi:hypothetical protein
MNCSPKVQPYLRYDARKTNPILKNRGKISVCFGSEAEMSFPANQDLTIFEGSVWAALFS